MASEEDGDDISLLSDSDTEAEPAPVATRSYAPSKSQIQPGSQGPTLWSEVGMGVLTSRRQHPLALHNSPNPRMGCRSLLCRPPRRVQTECSPPSILKLCYRPRR